MSNQYRPDRRSLIKHSAVAGAMAVAGANLPALTHSAAAQLARNETLFVAGSQWGPPATFNPLAAVIAWPANNGATAYIYEPLVTFNLATGGVDPALAESLEFDGTTTVTATLHKGTTWHDGTPLTSEDVVYTFGVPERFESVPFAAIRTYLSSAEAVDDRTVVFEIAQDNINLGMVRTVLSQTAILPKHIWEPREAEDDLLQFIDLEPVGSGPYKVMTASAEQVVVERVEDWWGAEALGAPVPKYIAHPVPKSNDDANLAFQRGELDFTTIFMPQIWNLWEEQDLPVHTWFRERPYHHPLSIAMAYLNQSVPGLDNVLVRKALAHAINFEMIASTAASDFSAPVRGSLLVPGTADDELIDTDALDADGWTYDPERAVQILEEELGATKGDDGIYVLEDGTRLGPWTAMCPYGWTDWMSALELLAQGAREVGFDITTDFPESPVFYDRLRSGDFNIGMMTQFTASAAGPWQRFRDVFESNGVPAIGEGPAFWNYGRYQNEAVAPLLARSAVAEGEERRAIYQELDNAYRADVPTIGLIYQPFLSNYNETNWAGFPSSDDPHSPPGFTGSSVRMLNHLEYVGE